MALSLTGGASNDIALAIIQTLEADFLTAYQNALLPSQRKALAALKQCAAPLKA